MPIINLSLHLALQTSVFGRCCFFLLLLLPTAAQSQKRQLIASDTVTNVAYIDHSRVRKEYKSFAQMLMSMSADNAAKKKAHDKVLRDIESSTAKQLRADSIKGGKNREIIQEKAKNELALKMTAYQDELRSLFQKRSELLREFEQKISKAIDAVVTEGGFTAIKPMEKEPFKTRGKNVTDQILQKLN